MSWDENTNILDESCWSLTIILLETSSMNPTYQIDILRIPPHSSHALQPLDKCPNGELKKLFSRNYSPNPSDNADERRIKILRAAIPSISTALSHHHCMVGWRKSGLEPYDPSQVLLRSKVQQTVLDDNLLPTSAKRPRDNKYQNRVSAMQNFITLEEIERVEV